MNISKIDPKSSAEFFIEAVDRKVNMTDLTELFMENPYNCVTPHILTYSDIESQLDEKGKTLIEEDRSKLKCRAVWNHIKETNTEGLKELLKKNLDAKRHSNAFMVACSEHDLFKNLIIGNL